MAPEFSGALVDGQGDLALSSLRGKTVVVNFWASWCTTCKAEADVIAKVEKKWRDKGVVFLGVDSHDTTAGAHTYIETYGIGFQSVQDPRARPSARSTTSPGCPRPSSSTPRAASWRSTSPRSTRRPSTP